MVFFRFPVCSVKFIITRVKNPSLAASKFDKQITTFLEYPTNTFPGDSLTVIQQQSSISSKICSYCNAILFSFY